jgi:hypothetical protein
MALPVVTVAAGGLPVIDVTATAPRLGLPVTEALNGRGTAVTKVAANGLPVTFSTVPDWPPGGGSTSPEAGAFLARTTGLDAPHTSAYTALIDGLVADGIWAKLDMLHIYATQDSTTALLNLVSTNYNGTALGSPLPSFTADRGYTGSSGNSTSIHTGFTPTTAVSPKFTRDLAHVSAWAVNSITSSTGFIMGSSRGGGAVTGIHAKYSDNSAYSYVNQTGTTGIAMATSAGHILGNRSGSSATQIYKNGASVLTASPASVAVDTLEFYTCAHNQIGSAVGSAYQVAMASIGSSLNSTEAAAFYARLRTYMTAVGVP